MRHCRTCTCFLGREKPPLKSGGRRKAIAKVSRKVSTRAVDGVITYPDGREKCATKRAWLDRRVDVWLRDEERCQFRHSPARYCGAPLLLHEAEIHHIRKRSLGRDDRLENLITLCVWHHRLYDSQPQWSKK